VVAALVIIVAADALGAADPVRYARRNAAGVSLHVVDVDLNDPRVLVSPALAARGVGRTESFRQFVRRLNPRAAINGTFFSKRSFRPIGDIVIDGKLVHFGGMGTAVAFAGDGVDVIRLPKSRRVDWSEHRAALAGGPLLVWDGFAKPMPGGEGFGDPHVFAQAAPRSAVGVTRDNHLLLVTTASGTSLGKLAEAMRTLGAVYAVNLDGGSSMAMWYAGRMIHRSPRSLTNVLCVYVKNQASPRSPLRPPRGLDWRAGHRERPVVRFSADDIQVDVRLPRRWEGETAIRVEANKPVPEGWAVCVHLDGRVIGLTGALPADLSIDLTGLNHEEKHSLRIRLLDAEGKSRGGTERIFRVGTWAAS
jgi:hypothetical protein